jgi:hypothetical protein
MYVCVTGVGRVSVRITWIEHAEREREREIDLVVATLLLHAYICTVLARHY